MFIWGPNSNVLPDILYLSFNLEYEIVVYLKQTKKKKAEQFLGVLCLTKHKA